MAVLTVIAVLSTLLCFIQYLLSKRDFQETCTLFMDNFNKLPTQVLIYRDSGFFFSFMRDSFYIVALLARENGYYTRDMDVNEVRFIKSLPREQTSFYPSVNWKFIRINCRLQYPIYKVQSASPLLLPMCFLESVETKERYNQCTNINCGHTFITHETFVRSIKSD